MNTSRPVFFCGHQCTYYATKDGLYRVGKGSARAKYINLPIDDRIIQLSGNQSYFVALTESGRLFEWNDQYHVSYPFSLLAKKEQNISAPNEIILKLKPTQVATNYHHTLLLTDDNRIHVIPNECIANRLQFILLNHYEKEYFIDLPQGTKPVQIATSGKHCHLFLDQTGEAYAYFSTYTYPNDKPLFKKIKLPTKTPIKKIISNQSLSGFLTTNNEIFVWDHHNDAGNTSTYIKLDIPNDREIKEITTDGCSFYCLTDDHALYHCNPKESHQMELLHPGVLAISAGEQHAIIETIDNQLLACGSNQFGELGNIRLGVLKNDVKTYGLTKVTAIKSLGDQLKSTNCLIM